MGTYVGDKTALVLGDTLKMYNIFKIKHIEADSSGIVEHTHLSLAIGGNPVVGNKTVTTLNLRIPEDYDGGSKHLWVEVDNFWNGPDSTNIDRTAKLAAGYAVLNCNPGDFRGSQAWWLGGSIKPADKLESVGMRLNQGVIKAKEIITQLYGLTVDETHGVANEPPDCFATLGALEHPMNQFNSIVQQRWHASLYTEFVEVMPFQVNAANGFLSKVPVGGGALVESVPNDYVVGAGDFVWPVWAAKIDPTYLGHCRDYNIATRPVNVQNKWNKQKSTGNIGGKLILLANIDDTNNAPYDLDEYAKLLIAASKNSSARIYHSKGDNSVSELVAATAAAIIWGGGGAAPGNLTLAGNVTANNWGQGLETDHVQYMLNIDAGTYTQST